ncbi:pentapeptide repeat-containing protein [Pseudomonas aeruginosa]|uniref:pentapeptide repeat-containing protein n=1 Tax=Pseudomonas aeruginosa TaxID=287 RepID=UPI0021F0E428|nr:pentapeptide repeat-containing protein [Pseudomonas aeruginosa]UYM59434.1 pentapeptide repeat-containing protein [Pseudomonas aeruginosa]
MSELKIDQVDWGTNDNYFFETGEELDLPLDNFAKSNLSGLELHRAIFDGLDLSEADFTASNLRNASLIMLCWVVL